MQYRRLFADAAGESHVEALNVEFVSDDYAPPAPAFGVSALTKTSGSVFVEFPAGWMGDLHPTPRRQYFVVLQARMEGVTSLGERIVVNPGETVLMEDTTGKGHTSRSLDDAPVLAMMIHLD